MSTKEKLYGDVLRELLTLCHTQLNDHKTAFGNQGDEYDESYDEIPMSIKKIMFIKVN